MSEDKKKTTIIAASSMSATVSFGAIGVQAWTVMSGVLMQGAALFSRRAWEIEKKGTYEGASSDDRLWHQSSVLGGIMSAASAVEAYANEIFLLPRNEAPFDSLARAQIERDWDEIEWLQPLRKLQRALELARRGKLAVGHNAYRDCKRALLLRSAIVHFKTKAHPDPVDDPHEYLEQELKGYRLTERRYLPKGLVPFPYHYTSHACLEWSIKSHLALLDEFADTMNIKRLTAHTWDFATR